MLEKIGQNIGKIFLLITAILLFFLGYQCGNSNNTSKNDLQTITDTLIVHRTDTIKPLPEIKWYPSKLKIRVDTISIPVYLDSTECSRIYIYNDTIKTKDYDLYRKMSLQGKLKYDTTGVKLKVPLRIIDSVKTTIRDSIFLTKSPKYQIHVGILASPKMLAPTFNLSINRSTYSIGYDPFNKQPIIGYKFKLIEWTPKKRK